MLVTTLLSADMTTGIASPEGVAAARGFLYLCALLAIWALVLAVRQVARAVTTLLRILLVVTAIAALGAAAVAIIGQVALSIGLS
ncbi:hypothetical protein ACIBQX_02790 [Nonomuraea sp. NPDC049714]|uniref:hypothetical protein n=1 Tax=Nonomuraea sp. NPDC049714 TaxID=3364357 RepID=UPI0037ABF054